MDQIEVRKKLRIKIILRMTEIINIIKNIDNLFLLNLIFSQLEYAWKLSKEFLELENP